MVFALGDSGFHARGNCMCTMIGLMLSILTVAASTAVNPKDSILIDADTVYRYELDESLLSASRPSPVRGALNLITVYDRKFGMATPVQSFEAALRTLPAVDLRERGGKSSQADISIRGGSADQTMVMLNGINFTDARTGHQSHSLPVDIESVSSVSLVRDVPGTGALSGAVNLAVRGIVPNYLRSELSAGQFGYHYGSISGARTQGDGSVYAALSFRNSDGYRHNTDCRNYNAYLRAEWNNARAGYFDFQAGAQSRAFGSNGFYAAYNPDQYEATRTYLASLRYTRSLGSFGLSANASYRKNYDRYEWTRGTPSNNHNTDNAGAEFKASLDWAAGHSVFGADYSYNHIFSSNLGKPLDEPLGPDGCWKREDSRSVSNIYLSHSKNWKRFGADAMGGLSITPYGNSALWSIVFDYRPLEGLLIEAQSGQSSRLPTFTDLYYTSAAQVNNLDLVPEKALNYNLDISYGRGGFAAGLHGYFRDTRDRIAWVWRDHLTVGEKQYTSVWHSEQISRMHNYGVEADAAYRSAEGLLRELKLSYGYAGAELLSNLPLSSALDYMKHKASLSATAMLFRACTLSAICTFYDRFGSYNDYLRDDEGNLLRDESGAMLTRKVDFEPYCLLDLRLAYERGSVRYYLDATNISNTRYCDFGGLTMPGCWVNVGVVVTLQPKQ